LVGRTAEFGCRGPPAERGIELCEFVFDAGKADLESFDFAEPAVKFGLDDPVLEVGSDLFQAWSLRWVRP
jgi:hypothetical protein